MIFVLFTFKDRIPCKEAMCSGKGFYYSFDTWLRPLMIRLLIRAKYFLSCIYHIHNELPVICSFGFLKWSKKLRQLERILLLAKRGIRFIFHLRQLRKHTECMKWGCSRNWTPGNEWWWSLRNSNQVSKPYSCSSYCVEGCQSSGREKEGKVNSLPQLRRENWESNEAKAARIYRVEYWIEESWTKREKLQGSPVDRYTETFVTML